MHKDVNWLESATLDMHNYVSWCLKISMRLYFAILGFGKRSLWCAGFTNPPKPFGWYRKYIGNRTIEETSANQEILTSLYPIQLIGQYLFFCLEKGKGKYLWKKLLLAYSLNWNFFLRNRKKEKETAFWLLVLAFPDSLNSDIYIDLSYFYLLILYLILPCFGEANKLR